MSQQTLNSLHERIEIREEDSKAIKSIDDEAVGKGKWREQISMRVIMQIANLSYCWFAIVFVYYGLNLNSVYLEYWNKYMNFIVSIFLSIHSITFQFAFSPFLFLSYNFLNTT